MNTRKRFQVEVDRLSRIEEDLERMSLCEDQSLSSSAGLHHHHQQQLVAQHHLQRVQDKLLESIPLEAHLMVERGKDHLHLNRDEILLHQIQQQQQHQQQQQQQQQQQMMKHLHVHHQVGCPDPHLVLRFQHLPDGPHKQYCRAEESHRGDASPSGNHYQHLTDFQSGRLMSYEDSCGRQTASEQKSPSESSENCMVPNEGARFLKEKYDSLGKVRVSKPQAAPDSSSLQEHGQLHHDRCINQFQEQIRGDGLSPQQPTFMHFDEPQNQHFPNMQLFQMPQQHVCIQDVDQQHNDQWKQQHNGFQAKEEQAAASEKQSQANSCQHQNLKAPERQERRLLDEHDLMQVDIFYRSQRSEIFVSRCCASLMMGPKWSFQSTGSLGGSPASGVRQLCRNFRDWACVKSGVPVLVLDTSKMETSLILAEHGSGFALWRNRMGPLTGYSVIAADFHALRTDPSMQRSLANPPSTLVTSIVGLNFADAEAAEEFYKNVVNLSTIASSLSSSAASNRNRHVSGDRLKDSQRDRSLSNSSQDLQVSGRHAAERGKNSKKNKKLSSNSFSKTDISQPCCFTHVTKLGDRFRDGSSKFFLSSSDTNMLLRGTATIDKRSALHRLQSGLKPKH